MLKNALLFSVFVLGLTGANAQETNKLTDDDRYNACVDIAHVFAANVSKKYEKTTKEMIHKANICKWKWGSATKQQRLALKAWYESFTGNLGASDDEVRIYNESSCEDHYGSWWDDRLSTEEQRTISKDGAEVVATCLQVTQASLLPKLLIADYGKQVKLSVKYRPDEPNPTKLKMLGPSDLTSNKCLGTVGDKVKKITSPSDMTQSIQQAASVNIDCKRNSFERNVDGIKLECTHEEIFNIVTSGQEAGIKIPSICRESMTTPRYQELKESINKLEDFTKNLGKFANFELLIFKSGQKTIKQILIDPLNTELGKLNEEIGKRASKSDVLIGFHGNPPNKCIYYNSGSTQLGIIDCYELTNPAQHSLHGRFDILPQ